MMLADTVVHMSDNEYMDDSESRFAWARQLITQAEAPAAVQRPAGTALARRSPALARRTVTTSRRGDGSFRPDTNVIQARVAADGMAIYNLRQAAGL